MKNVQAIMKRLGQGYYHMEGINIFDIFQKTHPIYASVAFKVAIAKIYLAFCRLFSIKKAF